MKLLKKQKHAVFYLKDEETTELIYGGAAGGAKSSLGCLWLIECCQKYPGSRWLMGRSKLKTLKETTLNTFFELTSEPTEETKRLGKIRLGIQNQFNYNAQTGSIKFHNGSEIILKDLFLYPSDPNFDSLGSLEITGAFIDECNQINYKAWQIVKSRIRYKLDEFGLMPKILGTCNPAKNWVYKEFYKASQNGSIRKDRKFIQALPTDNPYLPPSYIEALLNLDEISKQRLYYGNWEYDDDKATIISYEAIMDYWNGEHVKAQGKHYLTIDVARKGKDKTVFRVWHGWRCIKRVALPWSTVDEIVDLAKKLQAEYGITNSRTIADEDGVGGGVVDYLRCYGFVNNSKAKLKQNYANLKSQCSVEMAKKIEAREVVEECSERTIIDLVSEEMEQVKYHNIDKDGRIAIIPKEKVKELLGRSPDDWDSIMMRYFFELMGDFVIV